MKKETKKKIENISNFFISIILMIIGGLNIYLGLSKIFFDTIFTRIGVILGGILLLIGGFFKFIIQCNTLKEQQNL